jgi:hypothetical protein
VFLFYNDFAALKAVESPRFGILDAILVYGPPHSELRARILYRQPLYSLTEAAVGYRWIA